MLGTQRKIAGYEPATEVNGKPIARAIENLDAICDRLRVRSLSSYHSASLEETFDAIGEPVPDDLPERPIEWSEPNDGLRTVEALIEYVRSHPDDVPSAVAVEKDLERFQTVLQKAREFGTRFRIRIDI